MKHLKSLFTKIINGERDEPSACHIPTSWLLDLTTTLAVAAAYWAVGLFGDYYLAGHGLMPAPIWLPAAVAFAASWRFGSRGLIGLIAGSLGINAASQQVPLPYALVLSLANGLGPWLSVTLLKALVREQLPFYKVGHVWLFIGIGVGLASLVSAVGGAVVLAAWLQLQGMPLFFALLRWGLSDASGTLLFTPVLMLWLFPRQQADRLSAGSHSERILGCALTLGGALLVLKLLSNTSGALTGLPYLLILPIIWAAARLPLRFAHALSSLVALFAIIGAVNNEGAFYINNNSQALHGAGLMIVAQTVVLLVLGALVSERRLAEERLREANQTLEDKVAERTRQLAESEARFKLVADAAPFPLVMNRFSDGAITYANPRAESLFANRFPVAGLNVQDFYINPADWNHMAYTLQTLGYANDQEVELHDATGRCFWALISCVVVHFSGGLYVLTGINDISERKALESSLQGANEALRRQVHEIETLQQGLREQAVRDALTGLFNRRYLDESLERVLTHMTALGQPVSVAMLDVDHFKRINDSYGHKVGDQVLMMLGTVLSERLRAGDIVCRYGGEEFVAVLPGSPLEDARLKCELLRREIAALQLPLHEGMLSVTVSIGVATCPDHGRVAEGLLQLADTALYAAKAGGRNQVCTADGKSRQPQAVGVPKQ